MPKTLALLHTSLVFLNVETMMRDLFAEIMPEVRRINIVDDSLLADVMALGYIPVTVQQRVNHYIQAAERTGADALLSLCSSLGPAVDEASSLVKIPVIKIDDAMTEKAVAEAGRIGVIATVSTTLEPTMGLLKQKASAGQRRVELRDRLVKGAFEILMSGDREKHDEMVSAAAGELSTKVDLIVLAQASMTRLAPRLHNETGLPVLSSPRLAIEYTRRVLESLPSKGK